MADYQARINLLVTGQNRLRDVQTQLQQIEQTITDLERRQRVAGAAAGRSRTLARAIGGTEQPRGPRGQFAADPNRQQRFAILAAQRRSDVEERLSRILGARARAEADSINTRIAGQNRVNRRVEAQITLESRLNAAVDLYRTNLQKFERAGGTTNVALNRQVTTIRDAFAAFEAGGSRNLRLVRSLATELGRVGEAQREINRTQSLGSKGFEAGRRLQERLTVVGQAGVTDPAQIRRVRSLATEAIAASRTGDQQAYQEAIRRATAATARLERESLETAQALNAATKGYASSPLRGTATMPGSPAFLDAQAKRRSAVRGRIGGAVSGAAIGGAFPLLFGQGAAAAAGGAIGGLAGGLAGSLLGPAGGFAGSLVGTVIGDIADKANKVKEVAADLGLAAKETEQLSAAFKRAGADADSFAAAILAIQGVGFTDQEQVEALKLVSKLTEDYKGKIDKITAAYANFAAKGKVGISDIYKFTAQGIPILDALEKKFGTNREGVLQLAKDGKISAQELSDALVSIANGATTAAAKTQTPFEIAWKQISSATEDAIKAIGITFGTLLSPIVFVATEITKIFATAFDFIVRDGIETSAELSGIVADIANDLLYLTKLDVFKSVKEAARKQQAALLELNKPPEKTTPVGGITIPGNLPPSGGGAGRKSTSNDDAERERKRVADLVRDQRFIANQLGIQAKFAQLIADAELSGDPVRVRQLQTAEELVLAGNETARLLEEEVNRTAQLEIARARMAKAELTRVESALDIAKIQNEQQKNFDVIIADLQLEYDLKFATTEQVREQLRLEAEIAKIRGDKAFTPAQREEIIKRKTELAKPKTESQKIDTRIGTLRDELTTLVSLSNQVTSAANAIGTAFGDAFKGLVSGALTAKQALASFFQSVADYFLDMASQIIAKMIEMFILKTALNIFGGAVGGGGFGASGAGFGGSNSFSSFDAGGAFAFSSPSFFAKGGFVTGPTNAVIGEGGESEYVIPSSKMQSAMARYGSGARGNAVLAGGGAGGGAAASGPIVVEVRASMERINSVDYVTADQFQAGIQQAAQQGAAQGERRTLQRLQQSPTTRRRVGVG